MDGFQTPSMIGMRVLELTSGVARKVKVNDAESSVLETDSHCSPVGCRTGGELIVDRWVDGFGPHGDKHR
jgi:hypothetical protein